MKTKLIMVTGIPSSGKSTSSLFLTEQLALNGVPADWMWEIRLLGQYFEQFFQPRKTSESDRGDVLIEEWRNFIEQAQASDKVLVCDSLLSVVGVGQLLAQNLSLATIEGYMGQLHKISAPLAPKVIHLVGDVDTLLQRSYVERGTNWINHISPQVEGFHYQQLRGRTGLAGVTQFFEDTQRILQDLLARQGWDVLTIDVTDRAWTTYQAQMLDFIGYQYVEPEKLTLTDQQINQYVGEYRSEDGMDKFIVKHENDGTLGLYESDAHIGPLVPKSATYFQVKAAPLWVDFVLEGDKVTGLDFIFSLRQPQAFQKMTTV